MTAPGDAHVVLTYDRPALIKAVNAIDTASRDEAEEGALDVEGPPPGRHRREVRQHRRSRPSCAPTSRPELHKPTGREATATLKKLRATPADRQAAAGDHDLPRRPHSCRLYRVVHRKTVLWRRFGVAVGQSAVPDAARPVPDHPETAQPVVVSAGLAVGEGPEADPAGPGQPARHALDGPERVRRRHPRHARRRVDRLLRIARLHPDADPRRGVAVQPRPGRDARQDRLSRRL